MGYGIEFWHVSDVYIFNAQPYILHNSQHTFSNISDFNMYQILTFSYSTILVNIQPATLFLYVFIYGIEKVMDGEKKLNFFCR